MRWTVTPRRRKPNSRRWIVERTEFTRRRPRLLEHLAPAAARAI